MGRSYVMRVRRYPPDLPLACMDVAIGTIHILSHPARASSPALDVARALAPLWVWGWAYVFLGVALGVALQAVHHGRTTLVGLVRTLGPALFMMWSLMYLLSGLHSIRASFLGVPAYLYLAYRHYVAPARPVR